MKRTEHIAIGLMSGSSMDGMDLVCALFRKDSQWSHEILRTTFLPYDRFIRGRLRRVQDLCLRDLLELDRDIGRMAGKAIRDSFGDFLPEARVIGFHGHTALHEPQAGLTCQLGSAAEIAAITGVRVVSDFRRTDVALGGQGAPIVPAGEACLFPHFKAFLNIGGICNISIHDASAIQAFDVCAGNTLLNSAALRVGKDYDEDGLMARSGKVDAKLLEELNAWEFLFREPPKSLATEDIVAGQITRIGQYSGLVEDLLRTVTEHICLQLGGAIDKYAPENIRNVLVTGGGAHNDFLLERLNEVSAREWITGEDSLIDFKEALVMAFLALLRTRKEVNVLSSVTGASRDTSGGAEYI